VAVELHQLAAGRDRADPEGDNECNRELQTDCERPRPAVASDCDEIGGCGDVGKDGREAARGA